VVLFITIVFKDRNQPEGLLTKIKYPDTTLGVYVRILSLSLSRKNKEKKMFGRWRPKAATNRSEEIRGKVFGAET
jgi:hypothetical protein